MPVQFTILTANVDALIAQGFDCIEVWCSTDQGNSFEPITATAAFGAKLVTKSAQTMYRMAGRQVSLQVNDGEIVTVSFPTVFDFWTPVQVAAHFNLSIPGLAVSVGPSVVLTAPGEGRTSSLRVTYSDAYDLDLPVGETVYGRDANLPLTSGVLFQTYADPVGHGEHRYRWRYSNSGVSPISSFSATILGKTDPVVDPSILSVATCRFVSADGRAQKRKVIVVTEADPQLLGGFIVGNDFPEVHESDEQGFLQMALVRGAKVTVAIEGTHLVRALTVPDAPTFDLLTTLNAAPDPYSVQVPGAYLNRRSL